jgi:hypothetical protein
MAQQELNLLQLASRIVTEPSTRPPEIMWCQLGNSQALCVFLDDVPDYLFGDLRSPNSSLATHASEDLAVRNPCNREPGINGVFYPIWHWDRTDVPPFPYQINDYPMIFAALDMV